MPTRFPADGLESLRDKLGFTTGISRQFADVLSSTQKSGKEVEWVAHSQGGAIFAEAARISDTHSAKTELSMMNVSFHAGANNEWVTNRLLENVGVGLLNGGYRDHPFDPVPNIVGLNTINPVKIVGSVLALPLIIWGGPDQSPHTLPYKSKR